MPSILTPSVTASPCHLPLEREALDVRTVKLTALPEMGIPWPYLAGCYLPRSEDTCPGNGDTCPISGDTMAKSEALPMVISVYIPAKSGHLTMPYLSHDHGCFRGYPWSFPRICHSHICPTE